MAPPHVLCRQIRHGGFRVTRGSPRPTPRSSIDVVTPLCPTAAVRTKSGGNACLQFARGGFHRFSGGVFLAGGDARRGQSQVRFVSVAERTCMRAMTNRPSNAAAYYLGRAYRYRSMCLYQDQDYFAQLCESPELLLLWRRRLTQCCLLRLGRASARLVISPIQLFVSASNSPVGVGHTARDRVSCQGNTTMLPRLGQVYTNPGLQTMFLFLFLSAFSP